MRRIIAHGLPWAIGTLAAGIASAQTQATQPNPNGAPRVAAGVNQARPAPARPQAGSHVPRPVDDPAKQRKMDELLGEWERRSATVKTLDAKFVREDIDAAWKDKTTYSGRAIMKSPNLAFLDLQRVREDGKTLVPDNQIRCTGTEVYHYREATKQIFIYPLSEQDRQRALEEGPLPFLFNTRAEEIKRRYLLNLHSETENSYIIQIIPRETIDRDYYSQAWVQLNKRTFLPDRLRLDSPNGKDTSTYRFTEIRSNVEVNDKNFAGMLLKGWKVNRESLYADGQPARGAGGQAQPRLAPARTGSMGRRPPQ
jgi:TIGR03009 family protein